MSTRSTASWPFALAAAAALVLLSNTAWAGEVGVRIRFGLTDTEPTDWSGTATANPGKVVLISGWRFEQDDEAKGTEGWSASTRGAAATGRTNAQKGKAKAKAGAGAAAKAKAKAKAKAGAAATMADNGVLLTLADVTEASVVNVKTEEGDFQFKISEIPYGKV
ncbi:MAG TPA: hypothetical protein VFV87_08705, partial [Pirellulaceae bacterium]|nr:hypothetical protein [Pirellulaceae bacterium]